MRTHKVAVLDHEKMMAESYKSLLRSWGHEPLIVKDCFEACDIAARDSPDVLIADLQVPEKSGLDFIGKLRRLRPQMPVVICTAYTSVEMAVAAIKAGAFDYIVKPFSIETLRGVLNQALGREQNLPLPGSETSDERHARGSGKIIGNSPQMQALTKLIQKVSRTEANVLIQGESGTGKELVANLIHRASSRAERPFLPLDCTSLPETLIESELFGYEKGAFTGALQRKSGLLEVADSGTMFLDEVGDMPLTIQSKFLRVLQERTFRRVGATGLCRTDVRVIAATNRNLEKERNAGRFREDLFFRLCVIEVQVPPLRERNGDIPLLAEHFGRKFARRNGLQFSGVSPAALNLMERYPWPGNVRELQNVVERALTLSDNEWLKPEDLPDAIRIAVNQPILKPEVDLEFKDARDRFINRFEMQYLVRLLEQTSFNISRVARISGLHRRTIYRLMDKHGIPNKRSATHYEELQAPPSL